MPTLRLIRKVEIFLEVLMLKKCSFLLFSFFIGIVVGLATVFGQKYLPGALNSLANSG